MKRRATFVSFSGVDGAGKSTQIRALVSQLEAAGLDVRVIAFWDKVACLTGLREGAGHRILKGERGIGAPGAPVNRRDKNVRTLPMSCARLFFYFLDAWSTRRTVRRALRSGADFIVFDRYLYDELANLNLGNPFMRLYAQCMMKLAPRPDVSYVLDADPVQARARKPEYPLEFIHMNRRAYLDLAGLLGGMTVIAPRGVAEVQADVLAHALRVLPGGGTAGNGSEPALESAG